MQKYLILAQSEVSGRVLSAWREILSDGTKHCPDMAPEPIIFNPSYFIQGGGMQAYQVLVKRISAAAKLDENPAAYETTVVMVDSVRPSQLSAVAHGNDWDHLIAMLILTFPELRWVFGVFLKRPDEGRGEDNKPGSRFPKKEHNLASLLIKPEWSSLLDPTGLREWVKVKTNETLTALASKSGKKGHRLPERREVAAAIDEEAEYAFMHAYSAYRYGFRGDIITSWSLMQDRFGKGVEEAGSHHYSLLMEDMRLKFPDAPAQMHLSHLNERAGFCPLLGTDVDKSKWRFLVTTGQMGADEYFLVDQNKSYLKRKRTGRGKVLFKPMGGIADLWERMGMYKDLNKAPNLSFAANLWKKMRRSANADEGPRPGNAPGFIWPPLIDENDMQDGHGSPGKLLLIAETLLHRANAIQKNARSVLDYIRGAVLAVDAAELLGGRTPTLTIAAISLKNEFEVRAECAFMGVGYHFSLLTRLNELKAEVLSVTRWFHEEVRRRSTLDAEASVLNRMVLAFREAGRMEEEQKSLVALRSLNRKMSLPTNFDPFAWLSHALLTYGEWLLAKFSRLIAVTMLWMFILVVSACWLSIRSFHDSTIETTSHVISWFFGGTYTADATRLQILSWFGVTMGAFHIGVLISYLYSLISRK